VRGEGFEDGMKFPSNPGRSTPHRDTLPRMANPAFELAEILEAWRPGKSGGPKGAREDYAHVLRTEPHAVVSLGMAHIVDLGYRISDLKTRGFNVETSEWALPRWQAAFVAAAHDNRTTILDHERHDYPMSPDALNGLKTFGMVLETHAAALQPRPEFAARIEEAVEQAEEFVDSADVTEELRHYLLGLLARVRAAMHEGRPSQMREAMNEFVGATVVVENTVEESQRKGWADVRNNLLQPALAGAVGNLLSQGIGVVAGFIG
jgi:hypothetical protein